MGGREVPSDHFSAPEIGGAAPLIQDVMQEIIRRK